MPNTPTVPVVSIADDGTAARHPSMNVAAGVWQSQISMSCTHGYRCAGLRWMRKRDNLEPGRDQAWRQT